VITKEALPFNIVVAALGFVISLMSGLTFCLSKSVCFLNMYMFIMAFIALGELVAALVFSIPSSRKMVMDGMDKHLVSHLDSLALRLGQLAPMAHGVGS